jgi:hypothetical protein
VRTGIDSGDTTFTFVLSDASGINDASVLAQNISGGTLVNNIDLSGQPVFQNHSDAIEFRVYGYNDNGPYTAMYLGAGYRIDNSDDIQVYGNVVLTTGAVNAAPEVSTSSVQVAEGDTATFSVRLTAQPDQTETVTVSRVSGSATLSISAGSVLTFTTNNWDQWQIVTIAAAHDADTLDDQAVFECAGSSLTTASVTVTALDDDTPAGGDGADRWLIDLGGSSYLTGGNWNNLTTYASTGLHLSAAINTNGEATTLGLNILRVFSGDNISGVANNAVYPTTAQQDSLYVTGYGSVGVQQTQAIIRVQGLDTSLVYNVTFFASRSAGDTNRTTRYTIGSDVVYLNANGNTFNTVAISNITAETGYFDILIAPYNEAGNLSVYGYLGVLDIEAVAAPPTSPPDSDQDGLPDDWENTHFGGPTNALATAIASNGVNTLLETFIAGLDPHNVNSHFEIAAHASANQLTWTPALTGRLYTITWTTNLHHNFAPLATNLPGPQATYTTDVHTLHPATHFRIDVRMAK